MLDNITKAIIKFRDDRDWKQFHSLKNLAISISLEANELLEHFQWRDEYKNKNKVEEEVADIFIYLLTFCHDADINIEEVIGRKLIINANNYPIELAKGSSVKHIGKHKYEGMYP